MAGAFILLTATVYGQSNESAEKGRRCYERSEFDSAIIYLNEAVKTAPKDTTFYFLSLAYAAKQDAPNSKTAIEKALQLNPNYADAYVFAGQLSLLYDNDAQHSFEMYKKALDIDPVNEKAYFNMIQLFLLSGKP